MRITLGQLCRVKQPQTGENDHVSQDETPFRCTWNPRNWIWAWLYRCLQHTEPSKPVVAADDQGDGTAEKAAGVTFLPDASPTKATPASDRDAYFPGTEDLGPDEMRIVACGTGMPTSRPKQAATCYLVELGNGDTLLFDLGTGCAERLAGPTRARSPAHLDSERRTHVRCKRAVPKGGTPFDAFGLVEACLEKGPESKGPNR